MASGAVFFCKKEMPAQRGELCAGDPVGPSRRNMFPKLVSSEGYFLFELLCVAKWKCSDIFEDDQCFLLADVHYA